MSLSHLTCRHAKAKDKDYKLADSGGGPLYITKTSTKVWRFRYSLYGRERLLTLGHYPHISFVSAREKRDTAKQAIADGIDPAEEKQEGKRLARFKGTQTFELVALEWHVKYIGNWIPRYA